MQKNKITSIGEILFDVYPDEKKLGGAPFNFIYHIIKLTGSGHFISRIGNDNLGSNIKSFLLDNNINDKYIQTDKEHNTGIANANLDEMKIPHWKIEENAAYDFITKDDEIEKLINEYTGCLYFGTLAQRSEVSRHTIQSLFNKNIKYFCDLNIRQNYYSIGIIENCLKAADVLKLNYDELKLVNDLLFNQKFEIIPLAKFISSKYKIDLVCITLGSDGAILVKDENINHYKIKADKIVDTTGAGDAYAAVLCLGYLNNLSLSKINELACMFAVDITKIKGAIPHDDSFYKKLKDDFNNSNFV